MLVLNATYEPINVCTVRRATVLLLKSKAEVIEIGTRDLHWASGSLPRPVVIRLVTYVRIPRDTHKRKITRRAVFARDGWECQYCGARTSLTVDHVIPRSKGGGSGWDNIVASCAPCNRRKGDRLPHQINMHPRVKPHTPERAHLHPARLADDPGDLEAVPAARSRLTPARAAARAARDFNGARGEGGRWVRPRRVIAWAVHGGRIDHAMRACRRVISAAIPAERPRRPSRAAAVRAAARAPLTTEGAVSTNGALGTSLLDYAGFGCLTAGGTSTSTAAGGVTVWIPLARAQLRSL